MPADTSWPMSIQSPDPLRAAMFVAAASVGALLMALIAEYVFAVAGCTLCTLSARALRPDGGAVRLCMVARMPPPRLRLVFTACAALFAIGSAIALYHVGVAAGLVEPTQRLRSRAAGPGRHHRPSQRARHAPGLQRGRLERDGALARRPQRHVLGRARRRLRLPRHACPRRINREARGHPRPLTEGRTMHRRAHAFLLSALLPSIVLVATVLAFAAQSPRPPKPTLPDAALGREDAR